MFTNERQVVCFKSLTNTISLSFCSNDDQKRVFIVDFFPFSNDCSVLRSYLGANVILDITFISNYVVANTHLAGLEVNCLTNQQQVIN